MADALCARDRLVAVLAQPWGDQAGWKVGLTSPAARQRFATPHPLAGAIFLIISDVGARLVLRPIEVPVGIMTALIGGPFFVYLVRWRVKR